MRCDELCPWAGVGTVGERVERAYDDWLSAAAVGIVLLIRRVIDPAPEP